MGGREGGREREREILSSLLQASDQEVEVVLGPPKSTGSTPPPPFPATGSTPPPPFPASISPSPTPHKLPTSQKHYHPRPPKASPAPHLYIAPGEQAGIKRRSLLGLNGAGRNNLIWQPFTGQLAAMAGVVSSPAVPTSLKRSVLGKEAWLVRLRGWHVR